MSLKRFVAPLSVAALVAGAALSGWGQETKKEASHAAPAAGGPTKAIAVLHATKSGGEAHGTVTFTQVEGGIQVTAEISGLAPGPHGFHIHEFGDCSSADGMSTGGHFNPGMEKHAGPMEHARHVGDLGNIEANEKGVAKLDYLDKMVAFSGHNNILGRGVIVHEKADDFKTQPTGNAGGRIACGVIGVAKAK